MRHARPALLMRRNASWTEILTNSELVVDHPAGQGRLHIGQLRAAFVFELDVQLVAFHVELTLLDVDALEIPGAGRQGLRKRCLRLRNCSGGLVTENQRGGWCAAP